MSVFGMKHLRHLHLLLVLHLFAAARSQVNPGLLLQPRGDSQNATFVFCYCAVASGGGFGILQLFRDQNQVWGLLLKLYQIFASKNPELAAVYQPSLRLLSSSRVFSVAERIMTDLHRTAVNTERFPCSVLRRKRGKKTKQNKNVPSLPHPPLLLRSGGRPFPSTIEKEGQTRG